MSFSTTAGGSMEVKADDPRSRQIHIATFEVNRSIFGIDISHIQEIDRKNEITPVPQASETVKGVMNLRGNIVTVLDIGKCLGLKPDPANVQTHQIIIGMENEVVGLMVSAIGNIYTVDRVDIEKPPANLCSVNKSHFSGVFKTKDQIIGVLDIHCVLKNEMAD
jgi:purine-binding chemotaxis protein CheW